MTVARKQTGMVPGVDLETVARLLRERVRETFGRPVEEFTSSATADTYRAIARELLVAARLLVPVKRVKGKLVRLGVSGSSTTWIEPSDGSMDWSLDDLGTDGDLVEVVVVEPD